MVSIVHNFGSVLEDYVKYNSAREAGKLIKHVRKFVDDDINDNKLNFVISKIFDEPYNFLKFLINIKDKTNQKLWKDVLSESLELLNHFLVNFYNKLWSYSLNIVNTCRSISTSNAPANEKSKAINILCFVLKSNCDIPLDEITNIYEYYFKFCNVHQKTTSAKVQRSIFILLGIICNKYPYVITNHNNLIDTYVNQLKRQSECSEKDRDNTIVSGCTEGLSKILQTFPITDDQQKTKIYQIISKLLLSGSTRFDIRDVVKFISNHCSMLIEDIYKNQPELWFGTIKKWALLKGDNQKAGYVALEKFYTELANILKNTVDEKSKKCFEFFFNYFLQTIKNDSADIIEVRLAIRGFGYFAVPCEVHMTKQKLSQMFIIIVNQMEKDYFVQENSSIEQLEYLPDYIHCFSAILHQIGEYSFDQIDSLQQISVLMIKTFPKLSPIYHFSIFDSMILSMCYLYQFNPKYLESYLQRVVYQGVLWTCSHRTCFEILNDEDKSITYKNYLPFWKNLLNFIDRNDNKYSNIDIDVKKSIVQLLYDELMKTLLMMINKLNLNTKIEDTYEAEKIDDFIIFINVVDFYIDLLSSTTNNEHFKKWLKMFTSQLMTKSVKYPLVSGFYKLLKFGLKISEDLKYFEESQLKKKEDRQILHKKILSYLEKVLNKVHEFKDDLQLACLQLLLTIPLSFVSALLPGFGPIFEISLNVGKGFLPLATTVVDALEKWYKYLPIEDLKPLLKDVLPHLDPFLRSRGFIGDPDIKLSLSVANKSNRSKIKRKVLIEQDTELSNLQNKILMFVGQLNAEICLYLIKTDVEIEQVTWVKQPYLKFTLPYNEIKPNIYLDRVIPRILELALSSGDQKTRITACELLHSVVIFMLGTSRQMTVSELNQMSKLFEKVMLPVIQLGCDSNDVVRQLFNPLVFQIVHWYSSPMQLMSTETRLLIDILMDGISHPNNTAVRDLSGKCIKEFVLWTIKQSQKEDLEKNSKNIHIIVNKICTFCLHPDTFKRLGAALAFNNLYSHLREEESMIDIYWIQLMYSLMISMSLENSHCKNITQLDAALNHIERVLREKNQIFNKHSVNRKVPVGIDGPLLKDLVMWILKQTSSSNKIYRQKCIKLFCNLSPYVDSNCGCAKNFITQFISDEKWYLKLYEVEFSTLDYWDKLGTTEVLFKWFQDLLKILDAFKYLLDYGIINSTDIKKQSKLHESIQYFIENISTNKLDNCLKLFKQYDTSYICLPDEIETFSKWKCYIIIGVYNYLLSLLNKYDLLDDFTQNHFYKFLCYCVFEPHKLGFNSNDILDESETVLSKNLTEIFNKFYRKLPEKHLQLLIQQLCEYFQQNYDRNINLSNNVPLLQRNLLKGWLLIQNSDIKNKLVDNASNYFENSIETVFNSLVKYTGDEKLGVQLQSTVDEYAKLQLELCLKLTNCTHVLCDKITNMEMVKTPERHSSILYGEYFLNYFNDIIIEYILLHDNEIIKIICAKWMYFNNNISINIIIIIIKHLIQNPQLKKSLNINDLFENIMYSCYKIFQPTGLNLKQRNIQIELFSHIIKIESKNALLVGKKYAFIKKWFLDQLRFYPENEDPKTILQFHTNVLNFIYCFSGPTDEEDSDLQSTLDSLLNKIYNTPSNQLDNSDLLVLFKKLLDYLIISKSKILLKPVVDIFTTLKYEEENVNIPKALEQYLQQISPGQQHKAIITIHQYANELNYAKKHKINKIFVLTMLRFCHYQAFEDFYIQNIKIIIENLKLLLTAESTVNDITNKSVNLILIDGLFTRVNTSNFYNKSCPITKELCTEIKKGTELLKICMSAVHTILKHNLKFHDERKEIYRLFNCDALNCLISIICNSKSPDIDIIFFRKLFFESKGDRNVWKNIIDCEENITVPQDFDKLPYRKKIFVNIRKQHQQKEEKTIYYIESQSLFNSTLSEDICKFDFTNTLVRSPSFDENNSNTAIANSIGSVVLKAVDYNNHECMPIVCDLINYMVDNKISPIPTDIQQTNLPLWMEDIKKILIDSTMDQNVRIFIARIIHNTQHVFKYYATHFFEAIVKFITDGCTGNNINYFVADLVLMLTSWNENLEINKLKDPVSSLITFLIQHSCNDRQDMLKYNLEIIKTCIQIWKTCVEIPHEILFNKLNNPNFQEKLVAIHITGIILANDLIPWTNENLDNFIKSIVLILNKEKLKKITSPASELVGMILKYLEGNPNLQDQFKSLSKQLDNIFQQASDKWYTSLEQIQIHYPQIIDKYIRKVTMYVFSDINVSLKCICLKNILRRIDNNDARRFTYKDVIDLLNMNDRDIQLLTLQIINKMFMDFKKHQQIQVVNALLDSKNDSNSIIRYAMYEVLMSIYDYYIEKSDAESIELVKLCKPILLSGLIDSDSEIQEKLEQYWFNKYQHFKLPEKVEKFITELYLPDIESFYMGCMNYFLLHSCKNAPEYKKIMFEHPLSDCKFDEFQLVYNWRLLNATMTPMFSNSFSKNDLSAPKLIGIRETNSIRAFEPTQSSINLSSSLGTTSSFLFDLNTIQSKHVSKTKNDEKNVYGRMFLSEKTRTLNFAKEATERNIKTEQQRKEKVKRKETNVVMYRQYRKGDLPDIQIPFSALIDPLKILARRDGTLARQLFSMLFSGIINELENSDNFIQNVNEGIVSIFNQTSMFVPNVIGAFLDTTFENNKKRNIRKIYLNCDVLSNVCKNSGLISLGCLLMEEYISMNDDLPTAPKAGCGRENNEVKQWVKLADMYKELNEWDAVIGIFSSNQMNSSSEIANAINAEASCNWKQALNLYETLLNTDTDTNRKDFYYESYFKCFANLSDWENMSKTVNNLADSLFWDGDWIQEKLLPWYMMAETSLSLEGSTENTIFKNLEKWSKDKDKSEYLIDKFSEELAILSLLQNDANFSQHYIKQCFGQFLENWSHLNPLFSKLRSRKLLNFQKNIDLNKYLLHKNYEDLINYWYMSDITSYSIPSTEVRTLYRLRLINNIEEKCLQESQNIEKLELKDIKLTTSLNLVNYAVKNNNYVLGRKYCKASQKYILKNNKLGNFKLLLAMSKVGFILANTLDEENKLIKLTEGWYKLDTICKKYSNTYIDLHIESACDIYKIIQNISSVYDNIDLYPEIKKKIQSLISQNVNSVNDIQNYAIKKLRSAIILGENTLNQSENIKVLNNLIDTYMNLIIFAQSQNNAEYHKDIVKYVLRAMKLGSKDAQQIFPCLLQFPELSGSLLELFKTESSSVPTWMFLLWIPQLLASLNTHTLAVEDIIEHIALTYPQAIIYTYKLARENYVLKDTDAHFKNIIEKLDNILANPLIDKFLDEISYLCIPELYFNYHIEKTIKKCTNCTEVITEIKNLETDLNKRIQQSDNFKSLENSLKNLLKEVENISTLPEIKTILHKTYTNNKRSLTINKLLEHFSSWLANFKSSDWNSEIEIPGQYSGKCMPIVKYHTKISSFYRKITCVTASLRKPFYIKIFGNDAKEYSFLIKFGEDLRQDQRIQQLFTLTNNILKTDGACQERNLTVEQYEVIPLTKRLGLIKIVENSKSLSEFIFYNVKDENMIKNYKDVQIEYLKWIQAAASQTSLSDSEYYAKACLTYDRNEANKMFTRFVNAIPADILSKSFWSISMDPSTYTYLRQQFITSYSVMCIVHWLLGIGDRNLGNSLICLQTGRVIGIDFGYAFGATTQHSPIPELIPFRLTPHILNLMDPLKQIGFVEKTMIHCLKALKNKKHLLISTMDVFIKDPSVDWLEFAKSQFETEEISWYPNLKIDIVNNKLSGANPASITIQELKYNNLMSPIRDAYINIVKGDDDTIRKQLNKQYLNEEEQVKCLLDQATDYNILARQFAGLQLWI